MGETAMRPLPGRIMIQDQLMIGDVVRLRGKRYRLIGKYEKFGRFTDAHGFIECFLWWDVGRMIRG